MSRRINWRLAKSTRCYSVNDLANAFGVHPNTVRGWRQAGLKPIDESRPALFLGADVQRFGAQRRNQRKAPCAPSEIYCAPCRSPQKPVGGIVRYCPISDVTGYLQGECPSCARPIQRFVSRVKISAAIGDLVVCFKDHETDLTD